MITTEVFPTIYDKVNKILPITNKYNFYDLVQAVYCINICVDNRSCLESSLALNMAISEHKSDGSKSIKNYEEFKRFFDEIYDSLKPGFRDDFICEDFGNIKIRFDNRVYKVIIGTGHNLVFGCIYYLPYLAKKVEDEVYLREVLEYSSDTINFFEECNISNGEGAIRFIIPSNKLFNRVKEYFRIELKKYNLFSLFELYDKEEPIIEKMHFVQRDDNILPLYNSSILVDLYDIWYKGLTVDEESELAEMGILGLVSSIAKLDQGDAPRVLFPVGIVENNKPKTENLYTFVINNDKTVIIALNSSKFTEDNLKKELELIEKLHQNDMLNLVEAISREKEGKKYLGYRVANNKPILFVLYDSHTNISESAMQLGERGEQYFRCSALDMIYMLMFMEDFNEIGEYLSYEDENDFQQVMVFGGDSSKFLTWKMNNCMYAKGAITYSMLNLDYNTENQYVIDHYDDKLCDYPWGVNDYVINSPFAWNIKSMGEGYYEYVNKVAKGFGGTLKKFSNNCVIFFVHNLEFYSSAKMIREFEKIIHVVDDLNLRKMKRCESIFTNSKFFRNKVIQIMFMPKEYAESVGGERFLNAPDKNYVYSDMSIYRGKICIRYSVDADKLLGSIAEAKDRSVETDYFQELFSPFEENYPDEYNELYSLLEQERILKKEVDAFAMEIDYFWEEGAERFKVSEKAYLEVKKSIAQQCLKHDIKEGEYYGKKANVIIRKMQSELIRGFEKEIIIWDRLDIHNRILAKYADTVHNISVHRKRYHSFNDIEETVLHEVRERIIEQREEAKHNSRVLLYLLETNIYLERKTEEKIPEEKLEYLLAYANWLLVLSDNADICYFTDEESHININFEYVVDVEVNETREEQINSLAKRVYSNADYAISGDEKDVEFFERVQSAFEQDTGVCLVAMYDMFYFLQMHFRKYEYKEIISNVFSMKKEDIVNGYIDCIEETKLAEKVINIIDCISVSSTKIREIKGKKLDYLPIGERENRDNRFETKPLLEINGMVYFSPAVMKDLHQKWYHGLLDFYPPYEIGLDNVKEVIVEWKHYYEKKIVYDIENIFKNNGFQFTKTNLELHKIDKKNKHPQYLGDYDVFAVDTEKKAIYIIECKVLEKVGTIFDMYKQQKRFFMEHKEDEKFQRRIDYMNIHYKKILDFYSLDSSVSYQVIPYMVMNKVMISRYKKLDFSIIGFGELESVLK